VSSSVSRRVFLKTSAATGGSLILSFYLPLHADCSAADVTASGASFSPNAWLEIASDGDIRIWCGKSEMGQGVRTSLPMIVAEELCSDWQRVRVVQADLDAKYGNQLTGGSLSVRTSFESLRKAGAAAREMLISAAAAEWNVPRSECRAESSMVTHAPTRRKLAFEKLLAAASALQPPADPPLKKPSEFTLIGKPTRRTDTKLKITGAAKFGLDTRVPGMLIASIERSPVYGGTPRRFKPAIVGMRGSSQPETWPSRTSWVSTRLDSSV
jgi:isoquinoline 1-oxidoreductase beta subunit